MALGPPPAGLPCAHLGRPLESRKASLGSPRHPLPELGMPWKHTVIWDCGALAGRRTECCVSIFKPS